MYMLKTTRMTILAATVAAFPIAANAGTVMTVEQPGVQTSQVSGVTTETFNSFTNGSYTGLNTTVGVFSAPSPGLAVLSADLFGGAGGTGHYMAIGAQSGQNAATLTFGSPQSYMGVWMSALDVNNKIELYSGATLVGSYDATAVNALLTGTGYNGNPTSNFLGQDVAETFAYVNFVATGGTHFDSVKFLNPSLGTGFELDNISTRSADLPGFAITTSAVPLPPAFAGGATLLGLLGFNKLRRSRKAASSVENTG